MESYEEFCLRSLATLQEEGKLKRMTCEPLSSLQARSVICFYGRAVLSPLLSAEQRSEMCGHRERAVRQEVKRQNHQRHKLLAQIQDILDQTQTQKVLSEDAAKVPVSKSASGYTLVTDAPGLLTDPGFEPQPNDLPPTPCSETPSLSGEKVERSDEEEDISLDSLLKKSREYVKREQGSNVTRAATFETVSDKDTGVEFGFSLHHSPIGTPQTQIPHQNLYDPSLQTSGCLSPGLPDRYACLPSPESSVSPCARRRRPRPVSTGNIHISFPIGPADLVPRSPGRSGEGASMPDREDSLTGATTSLDHWSLGWSEGGGNVSRNSNWQSSHCGNSPVHEACSPVSVSMPGPMGHHDHPAAGFRRRCHTLDSQLHPHPSGAEHIDRSQERVPRFMAGVTWLAPGRRTSAAPLNQADSPSLCLPRPLVTPDGVQITPRMEHDDPQRPNNGRMTSAVLRNAPDTEADKSEQPQRRAQALEDMQRRLEEEHALQMSSLLAEQEKEQHRLRLEVEETERRLKERGCLRPLSGDGCGWNCPGLSPARTPSDRSPGHTIGFPSPVSSSVIPPSVQPPVYLWGPTWAAGKPRARLSLVLTAEQQRAFSRLVAITRGFLTRRLLKTEKVKHLRQTIADTQEFIRSFQTEAPRKESSISAQDLSLEERVRAQLRAALYDIHDIFFEMPLGDRLALLQQERELRAERKLRDLEKNKCVKERVVLSAATQRSLDRKKSCMRVGESPAQTRKMQQKPKSPTTNRVLKPSQCQNSPVPGQLNRQGSWYRKTPEERVKRSDSLKKQHSLG